MQTKLWTLFTLFMIGIFSCALIFAAAATTPSSTTKQPDVQGVAQVVWVKGNVKAISFNKAERLLKRRDVIFEKDTLVSDNTGSGQIVFTDNSTLSISENTSMNISAYQFSKENKGKNSTVLDLAKGGFRTITGLVSKEDPTAYQVKTPVGTIGVRGTIYQVHTDAKKGYFKVEFGSIVVGNTQGSKTLTPGVDSAVAVELGSAPVVIPQDKLPPVFLPQNAPALMPAKTPTPAQLTVPFPAAAAAISPAGTSGGSTTTGTTGTQSTSGGTTSSGSTASGGGTTSSTSSTTSSGGSTTTSTTSSTAAPSSSTPVAGAVCVQ